MIAIIWLHEGDHGGSPLRSRGVYISGQLIIRGCTATIKLNDHILATDSETGFMLVLPEEVFLW